ncbi:hypothetical protein SCYAM73S_02118 [Streptomyces cyaneofuscatus]
MDDHPVTGTEHRDGDRGHPALAVGGPALDVVDEVLGVQAAGAVVAPAAIGRGRGDGQAAADTVKVEREDMAERCWGWSVTPGYSLPKVRNKAGPGKYRAPLAAEGRSAGGRGRRAAGRGASGGRVNVRLRRRSGPVTPTVVGTTRGELGVTDRGIHQLLSRAHGQCYAAGLSTCIAKVKRLHNPGQQHLVTVVPFHHVAGVATALARDQHKQHDCLEGWHANAMVLSAAPGAAAPDHRQWQPAAPCSWPTPWWWQRNSFLLSGCHVACDWAGQHWWLTERMGSA